MWTENKNLAGKCLFPKLCGLNVENLTFEWVISACIPLSDSVIHEKAIQIATIATELGTYDFKASAGWVNKFRIRHISQTCVWRTGSAYENNVRVKTYLPENYRDYEGKKFNRSYCLFRTLPNNFKKRKVYRIKLCNERLAIMLCIYMIGEFENCYYMQGC